LPAHLERREVVHDLSAAEKLCPCCGRPRVCIGAQAAEQLEMEPARFFVLRTVRKSYACPHCDPAVVPAEQRLRTAGPAEVGPIAGGLCGPGLLAHVIPAKFADRTPLHRLAGQPRRCGIEVARSTHADDTSVKLRVRGVGRTRKAHLWVYIGDADYPYVASAFTADYTAAGPEAFLEGYAGYLQADALAQYEGLYAAGAVKHACCWAHARRKFVAAAEGGEGRAQEALGLIGQLYAVERGRPALLPPSEDPVAARQRLRREEQRRQLRQQQAGPVLERLRGWLDGQRPQALPRSALGQAIGYALNNWEALGRYLEQGYLAIDNLSERTLRAIAPGRNNWGILGSEAGGQTAAVLYSVVGTCKHLGIDPYAYLREALPGIFALGEEPAAEQLREWLPDRWLARRGRDSPSSPAAAG
jgi:transposase